MTTKPPSISNLPSNYIQEEEYKLLFEPGLILLLNRVATI